MKGTVYLVGAGPGASDLLTVRAARLLGEAEVVFHDALIAEDVLRLASAAKKIPVGTAQSPMGSAGTAEEQNIVCDA